MNTEWRPYLECAGERVEKDGKEQQHASAVETGRVAFKIVEYAPFLRLATEAR
jgi:hypothetical protein